MGSGSGRKGSLTSKPGQEDLFRPEEMGPEPRQGRLKLDPGEEVRSVIETGTIPADAKSRLIAEYLRLFERVTGGGLYIDGFAAPQHREIEEAWTARRVLEATTRLRYFWLCDCDTAGLMQLERLKLRHHAPPGRRVLVMPGDFNQNVRQILQSDRLTPRAAIFALLDQRNTECHWSTVRALACLRRRHKIELLYFVGTSWMHRSLTQARTDSRLAEIDLWWGGPNWRELIPLAQPQIAKEVADRFVTELGYRHVRRYPILRAEDSGLPSYYLIHASDHAEAAKLMRRAYRKVTGADPDAQHEMFPDLTR